jgi:hypothetical protein
MEAGEALVLASIRSDAYGLMQSAQGLVGINQVPLSLGPVPPGEMARVIREPSELLLRKVGPSDHAMTSVTTKPELSQPTTEAIGPAPHSFAAKTVLTEDQIELHQENADSCRQD